MANLNTQAKRKRELAKQDKRTKSANKKPAVKTKPMTAAAAMFIRRLNIGS